MRTAIHLSSGDDRIQALNIKLSKTWFILAGIGQLIFVYYIARYYGVPTFTGDFESMSIGEEHGYVAEQPVANVALIIHVFIAMYITLGGLVQIIPYIRNNFSTFHRYNGRLYVIMAILIATAGSVINLIRENAAGPMMTLFGTINALLIFWFAWKVIVTARSRKMAEHQKWALRLFMAVSATWFYRLIFGFWALVNQGAPGHTDNFNGYFDYTIAVLHIFLPLVILEIYFLAQKHQSKAVKRIYLGTIIFSCIFTAIGIVGASFIFWL